MARHELLTRTFVDLADTLVDDFDVVDLLTLLTDRCVETFEVSDAGLVLAAPVGADLRVMASSSATVRDLEIYELQAREGPCFECYHTGEPVLNVDLHTSEARWPHFTPAALDAGFRTVSAQPMRLRGAIIGALNLFRDSDEVLSDDDLLGARAFADVATIAILQHQAVIDAQLLNDQLNHALNSRVLIEQAKGMLAERGSVDLNDAFDLLRAYARRHNRKLRDVAQDFLDGNIAVGALQPHP